MPRYEHIKAVSVFLRIELAREFHCAQYLGAKCVTGFCELIAQKTVIEARIVRNEQRALQSFMKRWGKLVEGGRIAHHVIADSCEALYEGRNRYLGIDQTGPARGFA